MKILALLVLSFVMPHLSMGQSKTTQDLHKEYEDAFYMFFYKNTLQMINQGDDFEFAKLIKGIDKMKFLKIDKSEDGFDNSEVKELIGKYKSEDFEDLMTMRESGNDIKIFIKEKDKVTLGLIMLINDEASLSILDIKGSVPLDEMVSLYEKVKSVN